MKTVYIEIDSIFDNRSIYILKDITYKTVLSNHESLDDAFKECINKSYIPITILDLVMLRLYRSDIFSKEKDKIMDLKI